MPKDVSTNHGRFLHSFDGLRGIVVVLVLLQHETFLAHKYLDVSFAGGVFGLGEFRIDFFFILSGFFAAWVVGRGHKTENLGIHFLSRRLLRLLPLLWLVTTVKLVPIIGLGLAGRHQVLDWFQILRSYTLLPSPGYPIVLPAWTLSFELVFCSLWAVLLSFPWRFRMAAIGLWAVAILAYGRNAPSFWLPAFMLHPYFVDFIGGALLAETASSMNVRMRGSIIISAGFVLLMVAVSIQPELKACPELVRRLAWGGAAFLIVAGLFRLECQGVAFPMPSGLRLLAQASYSIYLTHSAVLYVVMTGLAGRVMNSWTTHLLLVVVAGATVAGGVLVHRWIEVPLQRALHAFRHVRHRAPLKSGTDA
jgi:peptidoglycan/LPS O-acetylase OafA/YrhL